MWRPRRKFVEVKVNYQPTNDERKSNVVLLFSCFRETLKTSSDEVHAALRDAELRVGQALSAGDSAKREAEAARAEVRVWFLLGIVALLCISSRSHKNILTLVGA